MSIDDETSQRSAGKREGIVDDYSIQREKLDFNGDGYVNTNEENFDDILLSDNFATDCARIGSSHERPNLSATMSNSSPTNHANSVDLRETKKLEEHGEHSLFDEGSSIKTDNIRPIFNTDPRDNTALTIPNGAPIEEVKPSPRRKPPPLTLDITRLETTSQLTAVKPNMQITGLEYRGLTNMDSNMHVPQKMVPPMHFTDAVFNDSTDITIGNKIGTNGDIILNQYVDISSNALPQVTITDSSQTDKWYTNKRCVTASIIMVIIISAAIIAAVTLFVVGSSQDGFANDVDQGADAPVNYTLRLISRGQWTTHPNVDIPDLPYKPARFVVVCHTAGDFCSKSELCLNQVRNIESWAISTGLDLISYNFLIGGDGYIYEGRGWNKEGAHTKGFNCASMAVAFMGEFGKDNLSKPMITAFNILIDEGVRRQALTDDYKLFSHKQVKLTESPGKNILKMITGWPHWSSPQKEDRFCYSKLSK